MDAASILLVLVIAGANVDSQPQTAAPQRHTSYLAGQSGWGSDMSNPPPAAAPTGDRYQFGATAGSATAAPPPSVVDRTRSAVIESGNALRGSVEAGIEAANRELYNGNEQVIDRARTAGEELSHQFQGWAGTAARQAGITAPGATGTLPPSAKTRQQVSNPFASSPPAASAAPATTTKTRGGVAPPPWTGVDAPADDSSVAMATGEPTTGEPPVGTNGRAPVQTDNGWTTVHSSVAPPRLSTPRLTNAPNATPPLVSPTASGAPLQPLVGPGGPNFPATISSSQPAEHSVLAQRQQPQPQQQPPAPASSSENWDFGWDGKAASQPAQQATIGNRYGTAAISATSDVNGRESVTQPPPANQLAAQSSVQAPAATVHSPGSQPATTFGIGAFDKDGWPQSPATPQAGAAVAGNAAPAAAMGLTAAASPPPNVTNAGMLPGGTTPPEATAPTLHTSNPEQLPWMPLVVVSLALAGSIGANLFLGYSYADARHKYRTLVQKTANKFRRATAA